MGGGGGGGGRNNEAVISLFSSRPREIFRELGRLAPQRNAASYRRHYVVGATKRNKLFSSRPRASVPRVRSRIGKLRYLRRAAAGGLRRQNLAARFWRDETCTTRQHFFLTRCPMWALDSFREDRCVFSGTVRNRWKWNQTIFAISVSPYARDIALASKNGRSEGHESCL